MLQKETLKERLRFITKTLASPPSVDEWINFVNWSGLFEISQLEILDIVIENQSY